MKHDHPQFKLRMPPDMKAKLEEMAAAHGRTLTAEIVARLQRTIDDPDVGWPTAMDQRRRDQVIALAAAGGSKGEPVHGTLLTDEAYADKIAGTIVERLREEFLKGVPAGAQGLATTAAKAKKPKD